ncbi:cysteine-rich venom protein-like isoform X2 [Ambystoma mexicanum]|uniref:cysteine-rich venom protein-like isoform X2 n=1 Tax=Ambystoma mexicanum TaxID=8296 RepID=UPI0037E991C5
MALKSSCRGMAMLAVVAIALFVVLDQSNGQDALPRLDTNNEKVKKEIVGLINDLRRNVKPQSQNMLKMRWSEDAATVGDIWYKQCVFYQPPTKTRSITTNSCGETVYKTNHPISWADVINTWYNQQENFTFGIGERFSNAHISHYTQIVWAVSYQVGCQVAYCNTDYMYSCTFCPAGNDYSRTDTPYEAGEPCQKCPAHCDEGLCTNPCAFEDIYGNCNELKDACLNDQIVKAGCKATCKCTTEIK